jgi:nitrogen regulatory protein PII
MSKPGLPACGNELLFGENLQEETIIMADYNPVKHSLIVTIVSRGYADIVIGAAKDAGARGGTVLYARGSGIHETEKFIGITIQPEKEVILTLVQKEEAPEIISAITEKAGLMTEGRGISFVLPVTKTAGIVTKTIGAAKAAGTDAKAAEATETETEAKERED